MYLLYPDSETFLLSLTAGIIPHAVSCRPVNSGWSADGAVYVQMDGKLPRSSAVQLQDWGVKAVRTCSDPTVIFQTTLCWPLIIPLQRMADFHGVTDRTAVLFLAEDHRQVPELVNEVLRQGNDRISFRRFDKSAADQFPDDDGAARVGTGFTLIRVIGAPFYSLLRSLESLTGQARIPAFVEVGSRVWVEAGYRHPMADTIEPAAGQQIILRSERPPLVIDEQPFTDVYQCMEFVLPQAPSVVSSLAAVDKLNVPLRLVRGGADEPPELFVLTGNATQQIDDFVRNASDETLQRLAFAVATSTVGDEAVSEPMVLIRIRPGRTAAPVVVLNAVPCRSYLRIPNLYVPTGQRLHPPLRRDAIKSLLVPNDSVIVWLHPERDGFRPCQIPDDAFQPLESWVDYVIDQDRRIMHEWVQQWTFDFEPFICPDDAASQRRKQEKSPQEVVPREHIDPLQPVASKTESSSSRILKRLREATRFRSPEKVSQQVQELRRTLTDLEQQFRTLDVPLNDPARDLLFDRMADINAELGVFSDSVICRLHRFWNADVISDSDAELWLHTASELCRQNGMTSLLNTQGRFSRQQLERLLTAESGTPSEIAQVAAFVVWAAVSKEQSDLLRHLMPQIVLRLQQHESMLSVRTCWLAWTAMARFSEDPLLLARARDRLLERLFQQGISPDRDVPSFLRIGANGASERFRVVRHHVTELMDRVLVWSSANIGLASPRTTHYVQLIFAFTLARMGESTGAQQLLQKASEGLTEKSDPIHLWLYRAYRHRIQQALSGENVAAAMPDHLLQELESVSKLDRYKIDRLREHSGILEPHERLDPYRNWGKVDADDLNHQLTGLFDLHDRQRLRTEVESILKRRLSKEEGVQVLITALELSPRLGEDFAVQMLRRVMPSVTETSNEVTQAELLEKALHIAAHFDQRDRMEEFLHQLDVILKDAQAADVRVLQALQSLLQRSFSALRRLGMRDELAMLFERMSKVVRVGLNPDHPEVERWCILMDLAGGWFWFGQDRGWQDIDDARDILFSDALTRQGHVGARQQTMLAVSYINAVGHAPVETAIARLHELFDNLIGIHDSATVNTHYSLKQLDIVEALAQTIISDTFSTDRTVQKWLDEEEFLIRRRIHHDTRTTASFLEPMSS
ncbi:MAG: hypothetical protein KDA81_11495 [Planctomycetaceae bacterium]|nr:hypothetical protein [Planctomycetaceae bacterium]